MDYDVVRENVVAACANYKKNDAKFYTQMNGFYKEGKKNPSVAKIILQDHIYKSQKVASRMLNDAASFSQSDIPAILYPEFVGRMNQIFTLSSAAALRSMTISDIYEETKYINENVGKCAREEFDESWNKKYPKTGKLRERIIEANRLDMDKVTPKAGWYAKINYAKTLAEYKKDYPKTFFARYALIMNGEIQEDNITSRIKGWFSRLSYKRLIKNGFCFKK